MKLKFSLAQLLLVFPAFSIAWFLALHLPATRYSGYHLRVDDEVRFRVRLLDSVCDEYPMTEHEINQWLSGKLDPNHPAMTRLQWYKGGDVFFPLDQWGNPYRCVFGKFRRPGIDRLYTIGIYSMGEDGISLSNGNDPDDINSWSDWPGYFYYQRFAEEEAAAKRNRQVWATVILTPLVYLAFLGLGRLARLPFRREKARAS